MSNLLTYKTRLAVGPVGGSTVETVQAGAIARTSPRATSPVSAKGAAGLMQLAPFQQRTLTQSMPSDARHDAVLRGFPPRLAYVEQRRGGGTGKGQDTGEGVATLTLNLPLTAAATWDLTLACDGDPTHAANATAEAPIAPQTSYMGSQVEVYWGGSTHLADLTSAWQGGSISSQPSQTFTDLVGQTVAASDVTGTSLSVTMSVVFRDLSDDAAWALASNQEGILVVRRTDSNYAYAIPAVLSDVPYSSPMDAAATASLTFAPSPDGAATSGVPVVGGSGVTQAVASTEVAYMVSRTAITKQTGNVSVPQGNLLVYGAPLRV